ncbi:MULTISPECIES: hypothetical protein [unclassified Nocardiopsis]|uniref:hypothetical protein n=1 Tax=Nocardiopsis TaxID=2013 RepID=UPI00387B7761
MTAVTWTRVAPSPKSPGKFVTVGATPAWLGGGAFRGRPNSVGAVVAFWAMTFAGGAHCTRLFQVGTARMV